MSTSEANGRLYRVGKHWYLDTALLQTIARRITVEPMQGGYQILAPAGLVRCVPASGLALPGQTGQLYRCQGQSPDQDIGGRLRKLAGVADMTDVNGGEWDQWPSGAERAREVEMMVPSAASAPVFEGLRIGRGKPGFVRYHEFGRVLRGEGSSGSERATRGSPAGGRASRSRSARASPARPPSSSTHSSWVGR